MGSSDEKPMPTPGVDHDPEGVDLAMLIARSARGRQRTGRKKQGSKRPDNPTFSSARPDDRDPQPLGRVIPRVSAERGWVQELNMHLLLSKWPSLVGPVLAQHSHPESWSNNILTVRTDATSWATQMRLIANQLVARLNDELGDGTVLRVDVKGPQAPSWKHGPYAVRDGRGPRDTYG